MIHTDFLKIPLNREISEVTTVVHQFYIYNEYIFLPELVTSIYNFYSFIYLMYKCIVVTDVSVLITFLTVH